MSSVLYIVKSGLDSHSKVYVSDRFYIWDMNIQLLCDDVDYRMLVRIGKFYTMCE